MVRISSRKKRKSPGEEDDEDAEEGMAKQQGYLRLVGLAAVIDCLDCAERRDVTKRRGTSKNNKDDATAMVTEDIMKLGKHLLK